ncbi:unnamed protein product [Aspergillus oryzae]|nr:unnamed protein product [Aspergillus oryzae]GMF94271.1 unnamed protein product [Aspergillus oryzae]
MTDDGIELSPTRQRSADIMPMGNPSQSCDNYTAVQQAVSSLDGLEGERGKVQVLAIMVALCVRSLLLLHVMLLSSTDWVADTPAL